MTASTETPETPRTPRAVERGALVPAQGRTGSPRTLWRMVVTETRLFVRDRGSMFFVVLFPVLLLTVLGLAMPWADQPFSDQDPLLERITAITGYTPIVLSLAVATVGLSSFPVAVATYRQRGVLRRMSTTPVGPTRLLTAQVLVNLGALVVGALLALLSGLVVLGISLPEDPATVVLAFLLAVLSTFAVGALVAARAPTTTAANGIGMLLYFVSLFFAGVWLPLPLMPDAVQTVAGYLPLGAASQAMTDAWVGAAFPAQELLVMAVWAAVATPVAVRVFRWT